MIANRSCRAATAVAARQLRFIVDSMKKIKLKDKILVILGPTSSDKTKLAVKLAQKHNGEIVSADSRQVYKGMDVGTGKDLKEYKIKGKTIKYHLIDVVSPITEFNLAKYQRLLAALQARYRFSYEKRCHKIHVSWFYETARIYH